MGQTRQRRITPPSRSGDAFQDLVEETWEIFDSIKRRDRWLLAEELGDTLYTVLCLALIAERDGWFRLNPVFAATRRKMIRRHAHVFGPRTAASPASALGRWQSAKRKERKAPSDSKRLAQWLKRGRITGGGPRRPSGRRARSTNRS